MSSEFRQFLQTSKRLRGGIKELLQGLFVAELLCPSKHLWLVSPWITDIDVIDPTSGSFRAINPERDGVFARLTSVLARLQELGKDVTVVTKPGDSSSFLRMLRSKSPPKPPGSSRGLQIVERETLHAKGLLGDDYCLSGSMNFSYSGMNKWDEALTFHTKIDAIAELRLEFENEYGRRT
jgi:phosphatidylserine/phosphatidylglycerophosphate/cardiolipin synthase-like enzyme